MESFTCQLGYRLLYDEEVIMPVLEKELVKGGKNFIQKGVSPQLITKVFETVRDKVIKKIKKSSKSMDGMDGPRMKDVLSKYYATQLPKKLFGSSRTRTRVAEVLVGAVHASGYDYDLIGPYDSGEPDFEDGFDLIEVKEVSGGTMDDSFFVEGVTFKLQGDGFEKLDVVENPKILLLNIEPVQKSPKKDLRVGLYDILDNCHPNIVLSCQAIDEDAKKELAKRCIYFCDLVPEDDLVRVEAATFALTISCNLIDQPGICLEKCVGTCKRFEHKNFENEVFGILSGCPKVKATTIVLCGEDKLVEEAKEYFLDMIPVVRAVMKENTLVAGGHALYDNIIRYVYGKANCAKDNPKLIIKAFANAIWAVSQASDKTYGNVGCNAVALGEGDIFWEPPSVKIFAIYRAVLAACDCFSSFE